ncbi:MAG: ABC transporter permease [Nocardioidaceae bacterium]|nr:ABC transporter permease [Nocardioidaceae bacterium]
MTAATRPGVTPSWLRTVDDHPWMLPAGLVLAVVAVWELSGLVGALPEYILRPTAIVGDVVGLLIDGTLHPLVLESLRRALIGFAIGAAAGFVLGLVTGVSPWFGDVLDGPVAVSYPIPKIALFPAIAVILGFDDRTRILVIALACFYPVYLNAQSGTRGINRDLIWLGRNNEASWLRGFTTIVVPAALPKALVGLRLSLALSFVMMFATEVIGFGTGLGSAIFRSRLEGDYSLMWAGVVVIGSIGFLADQVLLAAGRRLTRGQSMEGHLG